MEYNLSQNNDSKKKKYEDIIKQNNEKYLKLAEQIKSIRADRGRPAQERQYDVLELEIQQEEIERDTVIKEQAIASLYVNEMEQNLIQRRTNKEISAQEFSNEIRNIIEYRSMASIKEGIEDYDIESTITEMKLRLEYMKRSMGKVPKEQADKNIADMQQTLSDNEEYRQYDAQELAKQYFEYKRRNLYYQRNSGEISTDQLKQKLEELEQTKGNMPTNKEFEEMLNDLSEKHLEKPQQTQNYEREVSHRDGINYSHYWENNMNQDINEWHDYSAYCTVQDFDNKTFEFGLHAPAETTGQYVEYVGEKLGEEYARGAKGEKAEMAKQFAILEVQGRMGDFLDIYSSEDVSGYDKPKLLLQLEKVNGLNIQDFEDTIGLDTSALHQDIFVATYEIEEWDEALQRNVMKPIKEYYQRDEEGNFDIIGTGTEYETTFVLDGMSLNIDTDQVLQGESLERVTQREMADRLVKNGIENSMQKLEANGKVTEVARLTDMSFLQDFAKQCGIQDWELEGRTFIVSTMNEKGEEEFDIIIRNDGMGETEYEHLKGISATEKSSREMYTTNGKQIPGGVEELDKTQTLKEFVTQSGHRYTITRNAEGKLGFNEVFRENENIMQGKHVDTFTYSTEDLFKAYQGAEINQEDLNNAFENINRTKQEREQTQTQNKTNNFEGR